MQQSTALARPTARSRKGDCAAMRTASEASCIKASLLPRRAACCVGMAAPPRPSTAMPASHARLRSAITASTYCHVQQRCCLESPAQASSERCINTRQQCNLPKRISSSPNYQHTTCRSAMAKVQYAVPGHCSTRMACYGVGWEATWLREQALQGGRQQAAVALLVL